MLEPVAAAFGLLAFALVFSLALRGFAGLLRRRFVGEAEAREEMPAVPVPAPAPSASGRHFVVAIVGFVLHVGSFYFYLWGASANAAGLTGLMVMLGVGFCLMVAIFYSWARGTSLAEGSSLAEGTSLAEGSAVSSEADVAAD